MNNTLISHYDGTLFDLDGVIYEGPHAIAGAVEGINRLYQQGVKVGYVTNNASRPATVVAEHLQKLGIPAHDEEVIGSAVVAMDLLKKHHEQGETVLVLGTDFLFNLVRTHGFIPTRSHEDRPVAVMQGFSPETTWTNVAEACFAIHAGAQWFATNPDLTLPRKEGMAPGNGAFIQAIQTTTDQTPIVAGKPQPAIFHYAMKNLGMQNPLMVGDRLDTDIWGGNNAGIDTALVLTGVNTAHDAQAADAKMQPQHIINSLEDLTR